MFKPKTFAHLCNAMQTGAVVQIDRDTGYINKIEKEDGGGYAYIVTLSQENGKGDVRQFVRVES